MGAISIPILPSRDLDATVAFYGPLGFAVVGRWPGYLVLRHAHGFELHFWHHADEVPEANDVACYVRCDTVAEVEAIHAAWSTSSPAPRASPACPPSTPPAPWSRPP